MPIRDRQPEYHPVTGAVIRVKPALAVQFRPAGDVPDYAKEAISKMPDWGRGVGLEEDPFTRCGIFDSVIAADDNRWSAEDLQEVEDTLRRVEGFSFVIVDKPRIPKPWPKYDDVSPDNEEEAAFAISRGVVENGYSPVDVKAYELENKARPLVLEALDVLISEQEQDVLGVISA